MEHPLAYLNGRFVPASQLAVSPVDAGFVLGATVAEQVRTFAGRLFRLEDHLARLQQSLEVVGIEIGFTSRQLADAAAELVRRNYALVPSGGDLGLSIFVTPGPYAPYASLGPSAPLVAMHTYLLPFWLWAEKYQKGQALVTTEIRQVPTASWPASLKCRSRMHYYLADRQAARIEPGARALLLDSQGFVSETSTANVLMYRAGEGLLAPPAEKVLPGISLAEVIDLAGQLGIPVTHRDLTVADLAAADEVLLTSTPWCVLAVTRLDGQPIGDGRPGPLVRRLLAAWSQRVGVEVVAQAERFDNPASVT